MTSQNGRSKHKTFEAFMCKSVSDDFGTLSIKVSSAEDFNATEFNKGGDVIVKNWCRQCCVPVYLAMHGIYTV